MSHARTALCTGVAFFTLMNNAHAGVAEDTVDVPHLIAAYHQAVVSHDGTRLSALFVPDGSAWFSVLSDEGLAKARAKKPETAKLRPGTVQSFITMVTTSKASLDPRHSRMSIRNDGAVASVTFNFNFLIDGKEENRGLEAWQLVKGAQGWRIASIIYSSSPRG